MGGLTETRLMRSRGDRKGDFKRNMDIFSKVGSLRKEWEAEIWSKEPGDVARVTADGYLVVLPCQALNVLSKMCVAKGY